jgi:polar amino acid transport system substrate-binding protein
MADSPVAAYIVVQSKGKLKLTGTPYNLAPYGIAIPKGNRMAKPMLDALKVLMATGAYKPILSKWYVLSGSDHESADQRSEALARNVVPQAN